MPRIRSIKPEMRRSLLVSSWPIPVRWTFAGLLGYLDDSGRGIDDTRLVKAELYPLDDDMSPRKVGQHLDLIAEKGPLCRYEVDGQGYLHITSWGEHQKISHPTGSRVPPCPFHESSGTAPEPLRRLPESDRKPPEAIVKPPEPFSPSRARAEQGREHGAWSMDQGAGLAADATPTSATVIAAYVDAAVAAGKGRPSERFRAKVGQRAKALAAEGRSWPEMIAAASRMGASGWDDLDRELQNPQRGKPVGDGRASLPDADYDDLGVFARSQP